MDLECGTLRRTSLNVLHSALHPQHGLAWTDGTCVYLAPVNIIQGQVQNTSPVKLGEFDRISSLHWSQDVTGSHCYLCVVHIGTVSLWKVSGSSPKLSFKQIRKIHANPVPQGCIWNPHRDILCILNKEQCTFYFRHLDKKGSYSLPPIESGKIFCGCWSLDGKKLIIGIGSIVLIYEWSDIDVSLNDYTITAWKIPNVDGSICTMAPITNDRLVCSAELPLEALCKVNTNMFEMPDLTSETSLESSDCSFINENEIISPKRRDPSSTFTDSLLHLKTNSRIPGQDGSQLVLFELRANSMEPTKLQSVNIPGILSPDLLYCDDLHGVITVGSNSQSSLHVYGVQDNELHPRHVIQLESDERPKGVCGVADHVFSRHQGVLIVVGQAHKSDPAFLSSTLDTEYTLKLCYKMFETAPSENGRSSSNKLEQNSLMRKINRNRCGSTSHMSSPGTNEASLGRPRRMFGSLGEVFQGSGSGIMSDLKKVLSPGHYPLHRVGSSPGMGNTRGPLEDRLRGSHTRTSSTISSNGTESITRSNLLLPERFSTSNKPETKSIEVFGRSTPPEELSTQTVDFQHQPADFQNDLAIQKLQNDGVMRDSNLSNTDSSNDLDKLVSLKQKTAQLETRMPNNDLSCPHLYDSVSSLDLSQDGDSLKGSLKGHINRGHAKDCPDVFQQISSLEKQLESQQSHIAALQKRVEEISRVLEETTAPQVTYRSAESPDIVYLTYTPQGSGEQSITKAFILDSGRLQLESVKQAFSLKTVELIVDDLPCVVGANAEGYIPVRFSCRETMCVSGQSDTATITAQPITRLNLDHPSIPNGDVGSVSTNDAQPDVTANHQQIANYKHNAMPSSTFC